MKFLSLAFARRLGVVVSGLAAAVLLSSCVTEARVSSGYSPRPSRTQTTIVIVDDYDYYPAYEVYYSRNRREYVYLENNAWVRRSQPIGFDVNLLLSAPSVRVDFRDSPEQHHASVRQSYPKSWKRAIKAEEQAERREDKRDDKRDDRQDGRRDDKRKGKPDKKRGRN